MSDIFSKYKDYFMPIMLFVVIGGVGGFLVGFEYAKENIFSPIGDGLYLNSLGDSCIILPDFNVTADWSYKQGFRAILFHNLLPNESYTYEAYHYQHGIIINSHRVSFLTRNSDSWSFSYVDYTFTEIRVSLYFEVWNGQMDDHYGHHLILVYQNKFSTEEGV